MKILYSGGMVVAGSGKMQGTVFAKGRSGAVARVRVKPINPNTNKQVSQRSKLSTRSSAWRSLTEAQRAGWNEAANSGQWPLKNALGVTFQPTGAQLYNQLNLNLSKIEAVAITAAPQKATLPAILLTGLTGTAGTPTLSLAYDGSPDSADKLVVYATPQLSPGISRPGRSKYRLLTVLADDSPQSILSAYTAQFGALVAGQKVFVYAEVVHSATGQAASAGSAVAVIGA